MDDEQIWSQLELRADNVCHALQYALDGMDEGVEEVELGGKLGEVGEREVKVLVLVLVLVLCRRGLVWADPYEGPVVEIGICAWNCV